MAAPKSVWGIDIGQCALKALKLREIDGQLQAEAFDIIEHPRILSQPDADRPQLVRNALEQFLARNDVSNSLIAVSVPGKSSFTRFVKLPPVEPKKIPSIVRFEAEQQIPFNIDEVIWRWQAFDDPDSPDVEVGLFAIKRTDVYEVLDAFSDVLIGVDAVQMAPLALYNFMTYDQQAATDGATLLVDIGADSTNLVVTDGPRIWTRLIQLGGNSFTEALVKAFKLSFSKAEKLKRTAATSKYARQIFQAMRPVFADLVQEIQRSVGFYTSLHRDARFKKLLGLGNGFRLPGLQKFLEQNLNLPVVRADGYNALQPSPTISAPTFTENVLSFAVAYGLALQGLQLTRIDTNLLPDEISASRRLAKKRPWFAAAAALILAALGGMAGRAVIDNRTLADTSDGLREAQSARSNYNSLGRAMKKAQRGGPTDEDVQKKLSLFGYRTWWPRHRRLIGETLAAVLPNQSLIDGDPDNLAELRKQTAAEQRRYIVIEGMELSYEADLGDLIPEAKDLQAVPTGSARTGGAGGYVQPTGPMAGVRPGSRGGTVTATAKDPDAGQRGFRVWLTGRTPMSQEEATGALNNFRLSLVAEAARRYGDEMEIVKTEIVTFWKVEAVDLIREGYTTGGRRGGGAASTTGGGRRIDIGPSGGGRGGIDIGPPGGGRMPYGPAGGYGPGLAPSRGAGGRNPRTRQPDETVEELTGPVDITGRRLADETYFKIGWVVKVKGDGLTESSTNVTEATPRQ